MIAVNKEELGRWALRGLPIRHLSNRVRVKEEEKKNVKKRMGRRIRQGWWGIGRE